MFAVPAYATDPPKPVPPKTSPVARIPDVPAPPPAPMVWMAATDPPKPVAPVIHWPAIIPATPPTPTPSPDAPVALPTGTLFVVDSDTELNFDQQPADVLTVFPATGPVSIPGVYVDGLNGSPPTGKTELRSYTAKFVYIITANTTGPGGTVKLTEIPDVVGGWKLRAVKTITVGPVAPVVPPTPIVPPTPADSFTASLQAAYTADTGTDKAASLAFLQGVYKGMAASPATVATVADALAWMKLAVEQSAKNSVGLTPTQLTGLRTAIGTELQTAWATGLTQATFAAELAKVSIALNGVK